MQDKKEINLFLFLVSSSFMYPVIVSQAAWPEITSATASAAAASSAALSAAAAAVSLKVTAAVSTLLAGGAAAAVPALAAVTGAAVASAAVSDESKAEVSTRFEKDCRKKSPSFLQRSRHAWHLLFPHRSFPPIPHYALRRRGRSTSSCFSLSPRSCTRSS